MKKIVKELIISLKVTLGLLLVCSGIYPLLIWAGGQVLFSKQANGSLIYNAQGEVLGSELIGQAFVGAAYFHPRPSAAGKGYDATASSGSNLGPTSQGLRDAIAANVKSYREENGLDANREVPADAVSASGSGLDPHISPENAYIQAPRVAKARHMPMEELRVLIDRATDGPDLGIFGEARVNVLVLNLELDRR